MKSTTLREPMAPSSMRRAAADDRATELQRLLRIARAQRGLNVSILLTLLFYALILMSAGLITAAIRSSRLRDMAVVVFFAAWLLAALLLQIHYTYRLASALQAGEPIFWVVGVFLLSCIGVILLLVLSSRATKEIKGAGFQVGLLGGNPKEIEEALASGPRLGRI